MIKPLRIFGALLLMGLFLLSGCTANDPLEHIYVEGITYTDNYWEELTVPANAMGEGWPSATAGNAQSGFVYLFADEPLAANEKYIHFTLQMPHSWKEGTEIIPNVRFIYNSDNINMCVRWRISYSWANIGDNFNVASNIWALSNPCNMDSLKHQITKFAPISGAGKKIDSTLLCYLSRNSSDVSDNYTDTAIFVSVGLLYQVDAPGSVNQWMK